MPSMLMNRTAKVSTGRVQPASRKALIARAAIELKPLPYAMEAFEPLLSKESFEFHWGEFDEHVAVALIL